MVVNFTSYMYIFCFSDLLSVYFEGKFCGFYVVFGFEF